MNDKEEITVSEEELAELLEGLPNILRDLGVQLEKEEKGGKGNERRASRGF